jgi:ADP-ribose pyrophosphatase
VTYEDIDLSGQSVDGIEESVVFETDFVIVRQHIAGEKAFHSLSSVSGRGAAILAADEDSRIVLVEQDRPAVATRNWEIPRGGINPGEELVVAAARELLEETGIDVPVDSIVSLGTVHPDTGLLSTTPELFFVRVPGRNLPETYIDPHGEIENIKWVPADRVVEACLTGEIRDGFTVIAVLRAKLLGYLDNR